MIVPFIIIGILAVVFLLINIIFLIQGPPYVPSDEEAIEQIIKMAKKYKAKRILDMGSGDGRLINALAQQGFDVDGIELNPVLVYCSRRVIKKAKLESKAKIYFGNFWSFDVSKYDFIVLYSIKHIMPRLEKKLTSELSSNSYIVSNYFVFPKLKPIEKNNKVVVYKV